MVGDLVAKGQARETIRKSLTALAMTLDHAGVTPNPARDRIRVRLPREEPHEVEPPSADHVEAVARLLTPPYRFAMIVLDETGARIGELLSARVADLDEDRRAWLVRREVSKTRRARWVRLSDELFRALLEQLPPREDRHPGMSLFSDITDARLRMAIARACRATGVPLFSPHDLRHRRISLLHRKGVSWAEIGERVGQRSLAVTADVYSHALVDPREIDLAACGSRLVADRGGTEGALVVHH
jgi:integrase